jgi:hypothetical protein
MRKCIIIVGKKFYSKDHGVDDLLTLGPDLWLKSVNYGDKHLGLYSQRSIFFLNYEWALKVRVLHFARLDRLAVEKHSCFLGHL